MVVQHFSPVIAMSVRDECGLTVVVVTGDIDPSTVSLVELVLAQALERAPAVCFDVTSVANFGSYALCVVFKIHQRAEETGKEFFLRGVCGFNRRVLDVVDPDRLILVRNPD